MCWISPHKKPPNWIDVVPAVRVRAPEGSGEPWVVDDGLAGFDYDAGSWVFREEELGRFVRWALLGQLVPARSLPRYQRVTRRVDGEVWWFRRDRWWTSDQSVRAQREREQMRQLQEKARQECEDRQKERDAAAARRRQRLQQLRQQRLAEEARRRRAEEEKAHRTRMEQLKCEREEQRRLLEEQRAREAAEQAEKARLAQETARTWWLRVSPAQRAELFAAVADRAWKEEKLMVEIPEKPRMHSSFEYGVPLYSRGRFHSLYGIVRPCPGLVSLSPPAGVPTGPRPQRPGGQGAGGGDEQTRPHHALRSARPRTAPAVLTPARTVVSRGDDSQARGFSPHPRAGHPYRPAALS
ncbi:hypothetical protein ABZ354_25040 [Streptomyces sp. NPDC005925]|uniref:hypothetical protein n=1 Tax=Streptomyces sp. NPDC005925 TaxID=3157172 RepID=UPI0033EDC4BD